MANHLLVLSVIHDYGTFPCVMVVSPTVRRIMPFKHLHGKSNGHTGSNNGHDLMELLLSTGNMKEIRIDS